MRAFRTLPLACLPLLLFRLTVGGQEPPAAEPAFAGRPLSAWIKDLGDASPLVREEALEALCRIGPDAKKAVDAIRPLLKAPLNTTRLRAAIALGKLELKTAELLPLLKETIRDSSRSTRLLVMQALQEFTLDPKETAPLFIEMLADSDYNLRERSRTDLARMGAAALPALTPALKHDNPEVARSALNLIATLGPKGAGAANAIRDLLKHKNAITRFAAANALWVIARDTESTTPILLALGRDPTTGIARAQALSLLLQFRPLPPAAIPVFETALEDRDPSIRICAAQALWDFDGRTKTTLPILFAALRNTGNPADRSLARTVLARMKAHAKEIVPAVIEIARTGGRVDGAQLECGQILAQMGDEAVAPLEGLLKETEPLLRQMAIAALGESGDKGCAILLAKLPKAEASDQIIICRTLMRTGGNSEAVVLALAELLKSSDRNVVDAAAGTLIAFGPRAAPASATLAALLKDPKNTQVLRFRMSSLFGNFGPAAKAAVPTLVEVLKDDKFEEWARQQSLFALGQIGPGAREALPALVELLKTAKVQQRYNLLSALSEIDPVHEAIVPGLIELTRDAEAQRTGTRINALLLLGNCDGDPKVIVSALLEALKNNATLFQRREIVVALGRKGPAASAAIPALKELLTRIEPAYTVEVAKSLTLIGVTESKVLHVLAREAVAGQQYNRMRALEALLHMGKPAPECVAELLPAWRTDPNETDRLRLAEVIAVLDPKAGKEMAPWLKQQLVNPWIGSRAAVAMWRIDGGSPDGLPYLLRLLRDPLNMHRTYAAQGLAQIGSAARAAIPDLEAILKTKVDAKLELNLRLVQEAELANLHVAAARALWRIDPKKADQAIAALIEVVRTEALALQSYRTQAIEALAAIGPEATAALPVLGDVYWKSVSFQRRSIVDAIRKIDPKSVAKLTR